MKCIKEGDGAYKKASGSCKGSGVLNGFYEAKITVDYGSDMFHIY